MAILHVRRFGINVDDGFPEPNEDGTYPNDEDNTEKPDSLEPSEDDEEDE